VLTIKQMIPVSTKTDWCKSFNWLAYLPYNWPAIK